MNVNFKYFGKTHSLFISENVYWNWTSLEKLDLSYNLLSVHGYIGSLDFV